MTCIRILGGIMCVAPFHRLRLSDGRYVFMEWHSYLGPTMFHDRAARRHVEDWWDDIPICEAVNWFAQRGERA